ncbi:ABC transporter permease [Endozoicomonas sp. GU-1]|uniref:ABC transporter permease n=1 Tax=Endozoicomonas sp. GU-1 TaxID=3009078 RepID=UPI0022B40F2C|nr:ABC transporter permease [Endozoicomonas sp. GU-1]WBA81336.1 ABC transporter permease [Endozoicomonas sp. GU-1]
MLPAFGYMPVLGFDTFSLSSWQMLLETPALIEMLLLSLWTSVLSTLLSLFLAFGVLCCTWGTPLWHKVQRWLAPLMAVPHVALAFGVMFVLMPSGLLARLMAVFAGWSFPPDWQTIQDQYGISLILLLIIKETPFLLFMMAASVVQLPVADTLKLGGSLGYQPAVIWLKLIWPRLYPMIRLPVYTVLAFAISVVDVALVIGPANPPTFAVQIFQWINDPDLSKSLLAASGSVLLLLLVASVIGAFHLTEWTMNKRLRHWLINGHRGRFSGLWLSFSRKAWQGLVMLFLSGGAALLIWSFVWRWRFPSLWPDWSLRSWQRAWEGISEPIVNSLLIGVTATLAANIISVILLELNDLQRQNSESAGKWLPLLTRGAMYIPLLLPQMTFLFGVQLLLLQWGAEGHWLTVTGLHLLFVLPYCFLSLSGPWQHYDQRHSLQGLLLSGSWLKTFLRVKLGILWRPVMASLALGFAVSIAQYLPTLFASAGRVETVTTEAVSLVSGGNRRLVGVYGLVQMLLPFIVYAMAFFLSYWTIRHGRFARRLNS